MILVPLYNEGRWKNSPNHNKCIFLVKEQDGVKRPENIEQFTAFVRETYLRDAEDKEISSDIKPGVIRWLCFFTAILLALFIKFLFSFPNDNIPISICIASLLSMAFIMVWLNAKFEDMRIGIIKSYAKNFRKKHTKYEIPDQSHKWPAAYDKWSGM